MIKICTVAVAAILLAGCATTKPADVAALASQVPADYKAQIVSYIVSTVKDPYSIKSAEISAPTTSFVGLVNGGTAPGVCIKMNGKNSFGAYIGVKTYSIAFKNGQVMGVTEPLFGTCEGVSYQPFPELESIG